MASPSALLGKAKRAAESARLLLDEGDAEGAADRAYYALFHAARALLVHVVPNEATRFKTHSSVISAFGVVAVRGLGLAAGHGRLLNFAEELRRKADYESAVFADRPAIEAVLEGVGPFLSAVQAEIETEEPSP